MSVVRSIALIVFVVWLFVDSLIIFRFKTGTAENRDRFSLMVIMVGNLVTWIVGISLAFTSIGSIRSVPLQIAGLAVMAFGIIVRFIAISELGRFHTPNVAIREDHQLLETGLYRHVRHPSYLGALIAFAGFSVALGNWFSVAVTLLITPCIYLYRIHEEEQALSAAFGDAYRAYCCRTQRLIPGLY